MRRLGAAALIAAILAIGVVPALAPVPVAAATPNLTMVGAATYDVLPDEARVAVTVSLRVTNHLKNTPTKRYYFRTAFLTVLPGTSAFKLTGSNGRPKVSVTKKTADYTNLKLDFGANLAAGKSTELTLTFSIKDPGGAPDRAVRISSSLVSFAAWAYATPDTPGATVDVRIPTGYTTTIRRGPLKGPTPDGAGHEVFSSGTLASPLDFVADIDADRPADYEETTTSVPLAAGNATVLVRAWPDDDAWRDRIQTLVKDALPLLERDIGVPWPVDGPLAVHEALIRSTGGFAGVFAPADNRIDVAYAASDAVVLHELAHAWFNGGLVADRWEAEAFATYYADKVAAELGIEGPRSVTVFDAAVPPRIALNAWGPSQSTDPAIETWAYQASAALAAMIAERAGAPAMQAVWSKAASGVGAYQPAGATGTAEPAPGVPDWRGLLDLLETETGKDFTDLWRTWVARPDDLQALADRAATRGWYDRSLEVAGDWQLPASIREAMRTWQFGSAREQLAAVDEAQAQRAILEQAAAAAKVTLPDRVRAAFEGPGGPAAAAAEAGAELAVVQSIATAEAARPTATGAMDQLVTRIGLLTATPEEDLARARQALAAGDIEDAYAAARSAESAWLVAAEVGQGRLTSVVLLALALGLLVSLLVQRRRRGSPPPAAPPTAAPPTAPEPGGEAG